jgi:hypothetical protein
MKPFDNVKVIIVDKDNKFLVGRRYDSKIKYSTLGGTREPGEDIYQVLYREFFEETSKVLYFDYDTKTFSINDKKYSIPLSIISVEQLGKQIYFIFSTDISFDKYIHTWKNQFISNQYDMLTKTIIELNKKYKNISDLEWIKYIFKYKDNFYNKSFIRILQSKNIDNKNIKSIIDKLTDLSYYLEIDDLDLASLKQLEAPDGLYERSLVDILRKKNKLFIQTK